MVKAGFTRQADLAAASGVHESTISRVLYSPGIPDAETLAKLADGLGVSYPDLLLQAHGVSPDAATPARAPLGRPILRRLDAILADDSPIPLADREALEAVLTKVADPYWRELRRKASRAS